MNYLSKHRSVFIYGASLAAAMFFMKWLEWRFLIISHAFEIYAGMIAAVFTVLGIWLAQKLSKPKIKVVTIEKESPVIGPEFILNERALSETGISARELEVLELMAGGLSNQEIAARLFVSLSTIKTHSSNVFFKLEVQRRTQAVEKAKRLGLIP
ncbi:LuxR C-terminal-related transcriptional regulator [Daejeonella sp.]|uniref:helix-turn-helix transcriptional regulator n=1 Tax=Daejeonella sp. TaxID=2805397 RepID=UPI0030BBAD9F